MFTIFFKVMFRKHAVANGEEIGEVIGENFARNFGMKFGLKGDRLTRAVRTLEIREGRDDIIDSFELIFASFP